MTDLLEFWCDRNHPLHYWKWIAASWFVAILGTFPTLSIIGDSGDAWPFFILAMIPTLAHLYGFLANLGALREGLDPGRVGPALVGVAYLLAAIIAATQIDLILAFTLPISSVMMATLTYGVFFTGFMPLLAFWLVHLLLSPDVTRRGVVIAFALMTASWLVALMTGYFLGSA
jgi:hypothetical protein